MRGLIMISVAIGIAAPVLAAYISYVSALTPSLTQSQVVNRGKDAGKLMLVGLCAVLAPLFLPEPGSELGLIALPTGILLVTCGYLTHRNFSEALGNIADRDATDTRPALNPPYAGNTVTPINRAN